MNRSDSVDGPRIVLPDFAAATYAADLARAKLPKKRPADPQPPADPQRRAAQHRADAWFREQVVAPAFAQSARPEHRAQARAVYACARRNLQQARACEVRSARAVLVMGASRTVRTRRRGAGRPAARRCASRSAGGGDSGPGGESEPGEHARRAPDDHVGAVLPKGAA